MRPNLLSVLSVCALLTIRSAGASIFAFTDANGTTHYSNVPVDARYQVVIVAAMHNDVESLEPLSTLLLRSERYTGLIETAARENRIEPALVRAVILAESGCDPRATSKRGAQGLMQLMPATALQYGAKNAFDPAQNIRAGSRYLHDLADRYSQDLELVLAAYNAGPTAVDQHGGTVPPLKETLEYVPRVLRIYRHLVDGAKTH